VDVLSEVLREETRRRGVPVVFSSHQLELVERLCDDVAIVKDGRLVACGEVEELRAARAGRRWRAELEDRRDGWDPGLAGVRPLGGGVFELDDGVDPQGLLDAARARGRVRRFGADTPTLAELFREVVSERPEAELERAA
jgi:ABC-2 type transport system ATP-binding protein